MRVFLFITWYKAGPGWTHALEGPHFNFKTKGKTAKPHFINFTFYFCEWRLWIVLKIIKKMKSNFGGFQAAFLNFMPKRVAEIIAEAPPTRMWSKVHLFKFEEAEGDPWRKVLLCKFIKTYPARSDTGRWKTLGLAGNALERVQRVHTPADLWDITFCTRWFWGPELSFIEQAAPANPNS